MFLTSECIWKCNCFNVKRYLDFQKSKGKKMKNFQVMIFNAVVLIALGIYGYTIPPHSPTALISVGIGAILIILSFPVKNEKYVAAHIAVSLTGLSFLMFLVVGIIRSNSIIILMAVITLLALVFYISDFIRRKAEREKGEQK